MSYGIVQSHQSHQSRQSYHMHSDYEQHSMNYGIDQSYQSQGHHQGQSYEGHHQVQGHYYEQDCSGEDPLYNVEKIADDISNENQLYLDKMEHILSGPPYLGVPPDPTIIMPNVFLGTESNAQNPKMLKKLRITHLLNCSGVPQSYKQSREKHQCAKGITYKALPALDNETFSIAAYFGKANTFIQEGSTIRRRVLIYSKGVSRSGAISLNYMIRSGVMLLAATKQLKSERRVVLCNSGFMQQLIEYARQHVMLDPSPKKIVVPRYGRQLDRARMIRAHLPTFL